VCAARRPSVGVDFGTSTTLVASTRGVVPIGNDTAWMPSLVGYGDGGTVVTGERALGLPPEQVARSVKRTITDDREFIRVDTHTGVRDVRADELIVELLREAGRRGARRGQDVGRGSLVRLGCPAMWDGRQRRRLLTAAQRADLPVLLATMVDEPVAAGIAWLAHQAPPASPGPSVDSPQRIVVFDMGGGTLDIAVLEARGREIAVLAAMGTSEAGDALDAAIAADLDLEFAKAGVDIDGSDHPDRARIWLGQEAARAKVGLSIEDEYVIVPPVALFGRPAEVWYTREQLNEVFMPQMDRAEAAVQVALQIAQIAGSAESVADIASMSVEELVEGVDVVLLSGGMCHIPYVRQRLQWLFDETTRVEFAMDPPENAVAFGLAKAGEYGKINMYRPSFDVLLEWGPGRDFRVLYEAFTPLVGRRGELRYLRTGRDLSLPRTGKSRLRVVSHSGERLRATLAGRNLDGFPVVLNGEAFEFSIYPNGRICMVDAAGEHDGQVEDWHRLDED
jgi:molecular chaperone DnaK (HSP70)